MKHINSPEEAAAEALRLIGQLDQVATDTFVVVDVLIIKAEAKMQEATDAVKHLGKMEREWGYDHPATTQARSFALELNRQATELNTAARNLHEINKQMFGQPIFH